MTKGKADLVDEQGNVVATFNETCHHYGVTVVTVRPVLTVEASDPSGTEIREFHGTSAIGCVPDGTGIALVKSPGGDLGTLLIVLATGTLSSSPR
jgi:hypothetical protein